VTNEVLGALHETAKGLHQAGTMDEITMREFEALCLPPVKTYTPNQIKKLRSRYKASQTVFAAFMNISPSTVQNGSKGKRSLMALR